MFGLTLPPSFLHTHAVYGKITDPVDYQEDSFHARPSIKIPMPDHLKAMLVDDWENITKNNQLVPIPHDHPVDEILSDYLQYERPRRQQNTAAVDVLEETIEGLKEYFNKALGRILLYRYVLKYGHLHPRNPPADVSIRPALSDPSMWTCTRPGKPRAPNTTMHVTRMVQSISADSLVRHSALVSYCKYTN
jgi:hypothetical protein